MKYVHNSAGSGALFLGFNWVLNSQPRALRLLSSMWGRLAFSSYGIDTFDLVFDLHTVDWQAQGRCLLKVRIQVWWWMARPWNKALGHMKQANYWSCPKDPPIFQCDQLLKSTWNGDFRQETHHQTLLNFGQISRNNSKHSKNIEGPTTSAQHTSS